MGFQEDISDVSDELQIKIISWFLVKEGCEPVTIISRIAAVFTHRSLDPSLILELIETESIKKENFESADFDLHVDDIFKENFDDAIDGNADAIVDGDGDVTKLIENKSEYKSREKATCEFCQKVLVNKYRLNSHILKFHKQKEIRCQFCSKQFALQDLYSKHLRLAHNQPKPTNCDDTFINFEQSALYSCETCKKQFKCKSLLSKHELLHKKLACSLCDQLFKGRRHLKRHLETHGFVCVTCCHVFTDQSACNLHRLQQHSQKPLKCDKCVSSFASRISLLKHQKVFHDETEVEAYVNDPEHEVKIMLVCDKCQKVFDRKSGLEKHQLTCGISNYDAFDLEKGFQCNVCEKRFQNKYDMKVHSERHSTTPKYPCSIEGCTKKFFTNTDMKRHIKVSHEKQFAGSCEICGRKFLTVDGVEWKQHMDSHNEKKSLMCPFCPKSFSSDNCLKSHMVSHLDTRAWSCSRCPKTFKRLKNAKYHVKTFHNIENDEEVKSCCIKQQSEPTKAEIQLIVDKRKEEMKKLHSGQSYSLPDPEQMVDDPDTSCVGEGQVIEDVDRINIQQRSNHVSVIQPNHTLHLII